MEKTERERLLCLNKNDNDDDGHTEDDDVNKFHSDTTGQEA